MLAVDPRRSSPQRAIPILPSFGGPESLLNRAAKGIRNAGQKRPGGLSRFIAQGLRSSETSPKKSCVQKQNPLKATSSPAEGSSPMLSSEPPRRRLGLEHPLGRDPLRTSSHYHATSQRPLKTGHFYFARNRTFLLCLDSGTCLGPAQRHGAC